VQGAVLEPQGVVEIKFRAPELVATMHRIDPVILKLKVGRWGGGQGTGDGDRAGMAWQGDGAGLWLAHDAGLAACRLRTGHK